MRRIIEIVKAGGSLGDGELLDVGISVQVHVGYFGENRTKRRASLLGEADVGLPKPVVSIRAVWRHHEEKRPEAEHCTGSARRSVTPYFWVRAFEAPGTLFTGGK